MRLVFLYVMLFVSYCFGQANADYIVNLKGDTLRGTVKDRKTGFRVEQLKTIRYKGEGYLLPKRFKPQQIQGYSAQGRNYESFRVNRKGLLGERLVILDGKSNIFLRCSYADSRIKLLYHDYSDEDGVIESVPYFLLSGRTEIVRATQGLLGLKRNLLSTYFNQHPELVRRINDKQVNTVLEIVSFFREL
jgi:hypothetical protein